MPAFTYTIRGGPDDSSLDLLPCADCAVAEPLWAELAAAMAREVTLISYPPALLAERWQAGYAAVLVWQGQIISYVVLVPIACRVAPPGALHSWTRYYAAARLGAANLPSVDVYQSASGWTAPAWRGKQINLLLRQRLRAHYLAGQSLGVGGMAGLAQPLLARLGWQILGWSTTPFVSSLIGMPLAGFEGHAAAGCPAPAGVAPYEGPPIGLDHPTHPWSQFCYFWVSHPAIAYRLDGELAELCHGDLRRWRLAVIEVVSRSGALASLSWLPDTEFATQRSSPCH